MPLNNAFRVSPIIGTAYHMFSTCKTSELTIIYFLRNKPESVKKVANAVATNFVKLMKTDTFFWVGSDGWSETPEEQLSFSELDLT